MLFAAGLITWVLLAGPVTLTGHPWLCLTLGVLAGAASLVVTHGHVVLRRRQRALVTTVAPRDELAVAPVDGRTGAAVAFGAAGLFLFSLVFGGFAIGLGVAALRRGTPGRWGRPLARLAILLGAADLVVLAALLLTGTALHP
ncbi:hypothetical protein GCM10010168_73150 [Actinoplanes ianthinogenes]|uniref:DUF4190 domain-containing protein n=1 Tax=Actinoplanes ianthinogenes TaxID=122358 RepID=A0ABM7LN52_9ACTN|nr:hypothetical protein [Actinoplanes ianthinogenes]BCJ40697.1 hypothetical protein Aiant_13540 [Actinoplanes ianthinogenes]GGR43556.1 hypothetical protein GCM10010168_73150 [Actinoplanes ianthinogenes]